MVTPEGVDVPLYFSKGSGSMTGGGNKMTTELQGYEENFPKLLRPTKGSSMRDNIVGDTEINTGDLENTLNKYNLSFDDMKRIDIDSPEIYNNSSAEGRDMLEGLELLTYPRKKPIYSQDYNEGMGTLDFYDTESGPIGIMQMDIDDSIEEMVFFVPNNRGFNKLNNEPGKQTREVQLNGRKDELIKDYEAMTERMPPDQARRMFPSDEIDEIDEQLYNLAGSTQVKPGSLKKLSPIMSSRRLPGHVSNKVAGNDAISASIKGKGRVRGAEVIDSIVRDLQDSGVTGDKFLSNQRFDRTVRMEGTLNGEKVVFNSTPVDNISDEYIVSLRKMNGQGTQLSDRANKIRILENTLHEKTAVRNKEYGAMSVKKLGELDIGIGKLKAEIRSLKALKG